MHVLCPVDATKRFLLPDEVFDMINIFGKVEYAESFVTLSKVSVADKTCPHGQTFILLSDRVKDLGQGALCSLNPLLHRTGAVHDEAKVEHVLLF